jgi:hypothetical protein
MGSRRQYVPLGVLDAAPSGVPRILGASFVRRLSVRKPMFLVAFLSLPVMLLTFALRAREAARSSGCGGQLYQYGFCLYSYEQTTGSLPPASSVDTTGRRLHSWRLEMLRSWPEHELSTRYDFGVAWDHSNNAWLSKYENSGHFYWCPSGNAHTTKVTDYVAVIGPHTAWPGHKGRRLAEITDDRSSTVLLVEVADSGVPWYEPRDLTLEEYLASGPSSHHDGHFFALFADFKVRAVRTDVNRKTLEALLTIDGRETIDPKAWTAK